MTPMIAPLLQQAAAAAAADQQYPAAALYVVATPVGNLADITLRALHVLHLVDAIACEDTRHSGPLLWRYGVSAKPLIALHAHNEQSAAQAVVERLQIGERVAYVSDAGTPSISDPGAILVSAVVQAGFRCIPLPGASSVVTALSVAPQAGMDGFIFRGFLPAKGKPRSLALTALCEERSAIVLFEAPHRIAALAQELAKVLGQRNVTWCRELTKQFETVITLAADAGPAWFAQDANRERGEFVVVVHALPGDSSAKDASEQDNLLRVLLSKLPLRQAVSLAAQVSGAPRNALYGRALALKKDADESGLGS